MEKEITVKEVENALYKYENIEEPIIVKRDNKRDVVIIDIEEYQKRMYLSEVASKVAKGEDDLKNGKIRNAREVFGRLREKYGY